MWTVPLLASLVVSFPQTPTSQPTGVEAKPAAAKKAEVVTPVRTLDDAEARKLLAEFKRATRNKKSRMADRMAAVTALGEASHAKLVKPLANVVQRDSALTIRRAAARALGQQPAANARKAIVKLLDSKRVGEEPALAADLVTSFGNAGYRGGDDWKLLERMFEADFSEPHRLKQQRIFQLVKQHMELDALPLLARHLDEPAPENPNSPDNPPAEYWEARWKSWRVWRKDVKEALLALTGQKFSTGEEARAWIRKNARKLRDRKRDKRK